MARLKTFITSDGLNDFVVATTSRAKALAAWGVKQDLFKQGAAQETDDPALVKAAQKAPGVMLERPAGGRKGPVRLPPAPPKPTAARAQQAVRRQIETLTAKIASVEAEQEAAQTDIARRRAALDAEDERLNKRFEAQKAKLGDRLAAARRKL